MVYFGEFFKTVGEKLVGNAQIEKFKWDILGDFQTMCTTSNWSYLFSFSPETPSLYENNHYHEECLKCNSCGMNLSGANQKRARRFKDQILCDLHFADMALMESSDFMQQLRNFKPQSLGCAVARRKSSTTLIFPLPPQACSGNHQNSFNLKNESWTSEL